MHYDFKSLVDNLLYEYENYPTTQRHVDGPKDKLVGIFAAKLRRLTIKFDTHKLWLNMPMKQHMRKMSNMI